VDVRFCVHATEDQDKVLKAVYNVLATEEPEEVEFTKSEVEGHYGNPITFFETRIKTKKPIQALVDNIAANLSSLNKTELANTLDKCFEKGSFYIRLDKQVAFQNKIKLVTSDPIRIRIRFRKNKLEDVAEVCRELGMLT
jgi:RNA binding exosome subunit